MAERPLSSAVSRDTLAVAANTPLVDSDDASLREPRPGFMAIDGAESPRNSSYPNSFAPAESSSLLAPGKAEAYTDDPAGGEEPVAAPPSTRKSKRRPIVLALLALAALALITVAVVVPVFFTVIKPKQNRNAAASSGGSSGSGSSSGGTSGGGKPGKGSTNVGITGGDGSTVKTLNGTEFTYVNKLGGIWYADANDPYNNNAYPNSWTKPLNQSWDYNTDRIYGVNLGGWFVLEPFITPQLYQKYPGAVDEWTLSTLMAADTASGGLSQIEDHYKTFITEDDFAEMAGAGLNWIRLPIPYWCIDTWGDEPFLAKTSWKYILQALEWARKYGLRVKLDLHTIPGSQNAYNHSGKLGQVNFLQGTMGIANAQRALNYIRIIAEFISQPEWKDVVPIFGIINEPVVDLTVLRSFYVEAYTMLRGITGIGEGKGFYISMHDSFQLGKWGGFMTGADRMIIDEHGYFAFGGGAATDPLDTGTGANAGGVWPQKVCDTWWSSMNTSRNAFGVTIAGEWSNAINDCGTFVVGVGNSASYGGNCADWTDSSNWSDGTKAGLMRFAQASMDTFGDWFFWTWKVDPGQSGHVESPLWSYQLGLRGGWMPTDPRTALGTCGASTGPVFNGFTTWQTGGAGAGDVSAAALAQYPYPPTTIDDIGDPVPQLPVYTSTVSVSTLPVATFTNTAGKTMTTGGNGWFNANDNAPAPTTISGCSYPDPWNAQNVAAPAGCTGGSVVPPAITPPPSR